MYLIDINKKYDIVDVKSNLPGITGKLIKIIKKNKVVLSVHGTGINYYKNFEKNIIQAGTVLQDNNILSNGGRVLSVIAKNASLDIARSQCYQTVSEIEWDKSFYRQDIAATVC